MPDGLEVTLGWVLALLQLGVWLMLVAASVHLLRSARWARGKRLDGALLSLPVGELPVVTVQLPLRNERHVAERVLRATCALDWPRDRLEVQVLDDSDDETCALVDRTAAELRAFGHDITVVRRQGRAGYKAGALANALRTARGSFVAILDADCVPPPDFLQRLVAPLLRDEQLAFTQARWSFDNEAESLLTRVQALILHGLFLVEQPRLSASGAPLQFNGTSGVWRRAALERAGGWLGAGDGASASVTEDLDLSYRVQLAGLRGRILPEVAVRTELPSTMAAFRTQQQRWVRGGGEVLRALFRRLLSGTGPAGERLTMLAHLLRHARQPLLVLLTLWLPATTLGLLTPAFTIPYAWPLVLGLVHVALISYYGAALTRLGRSWLSALSLAPVLVALSLGLSPALSAALLGGLFSGGRPAEFVRTPKAGDAALSTYRPRRRLPLFEIIVGLTYLALALFAATHAAFPTAAALLAFPAFGYLWVGFSSAFDA